MKRIILGLVSFSLLTISCKENVEFKVEYPKKENESTKQEQKYGNPADVKADHGPFQMIGLTYKYQDLEPHLDAKTMEIHYSKHHLGYTNKLNKAVKELSLEDKSIEDILKSADLNRPFLRNNAGGYYNHNLFFSILSASPKAPEGKLLEQINQDFGSLNQLTEQLTAAAATRFGSGWAWLVLTKEGKLAVTDTANQDNPLMPNATIKGQPILGIDVWEHAYYLNYQNKRKDYIKAVFNVIDWSKVAENYTKAL